MAFSMQLPRTVSPADTLRGPFSRQLGAIAGIGMCATPMTPSLQAPSSMFAHGLIYVPNYGVMPLACTPSIEHVGPHQCRQYQYPGAAQVPQPSSAAASIGNVHSAANLEQLHPPPVASRAQHDVPSALLPKIKPFPSLGVIGSFVSLLRYMELGVQNGGEPFNRRESDTGGAWRKGNGNGKRWAELKNGWDEMVHICNIQGTGGRTALMAAAMGLDEEVRLSGRPFPTWLKGVLMTRRSCRLSKV
jgi:hypothetical protein